jgi:ABC-2 type transport system ATP-binding protein
MSMGLEIDNVTKSFGDKVAVNQLSISVPQGSIYGFLGPNGAGKTTTIRMVMSILFPDSGSIRLFGGHDAIGSKDRLGYLPEEKGLYKKMRARELIAYFGRLKGMKRQDANDRAVELLTKFGLGDVVEHRCDSLSKGMGQKVQIIATLLHGPELVILDEPFSGLDPINVEVVRDIILELKREGKTVIFSTHIMEQAEQICDYILLMNKGQKILNGSLSEVKQAASQTVYLEYDGDASQIFSELSGVSRVNDMGKAAELSLEPDADHQRVLQSLVGKLTIHQFSVKTPSLHEIFIRSIGESA